MMIYAHGLLSREIRRSFLRNICLSRFYYENHYDVLKLPRNCTQKDIKDAFIKLSKEYHPDRRKTDDSQKFVKLNEAYTVLSHPKTRRDYDLGLVSIDFPVQGARRSHPSQQYWENHYQHNSYYGIKGLKRFPNWWVAVFFIVISICGTWLQLYRIRQFPLFTQMTEKKMLRNALHEDHERTQAGDNNESALKELKETIKAQEGTSTV